MKCLSYILVFFVVFFTIQPTLALTTVKAEIGCCDSGCTDDGDTQDKQDKGDCKDNACNPFQSCCCCLGFTLKTFSFRIDQPVTQNSSLVLLVDNSTSQFSPDVWQPPKIS